MANETIDNPRLEPGVWTTGPNGELIPDYESTFPTINEGEEAHERNDPVEGRVIEVVKGGLILDLGVRGFLPASLVDIRRVQDLDEFLGQELRCKVIELNRSRNNVVLSRRAVLEEERKEQRQQILDKLQPGDVVEGQISNIVDFGAFVDLDGMDGLIHISELSWSHVNHPSEILSIGDVVPVKVLDIDSERRRLSLSVKRVEEQLPHIRSAAEAGAAAAAEAGGGQDIGDVADLGLSEDVFAGPSISGADALRAALPQEAPEAEPAPDAVDPLPAEEAPETETADTPDEAAPAAPDQSEEQPAEE